MPHANDINTNPNQRTKEPMMNTNTTPGLDLNTILSAAVLQIVTQATATLAARVDELERVNATQADTIAALLRGLNRVEGMLDGTSPSDRDYERLGNRVDELERSVEKQIADAMRAHTDEYDHDDFGPEIDENELDDKIKHKIKRAIDAHEDEFDHGQLDSLDLDLNRKIADAIETHARDDNHPDDDAITDMVRDTLREATVRITFD